MRASAETPFATGTPYAEREIATRMLRARERGDAVRDGTALDQHKNAICRAAGDLSLRCGLPGGATLMPMTEAERIWVRLCAALEPHAPGAVSALQPAAKPEAVRVLEEMLGAALPPDLAQSLAVHDGQSPPHMSEVLFDNEYLLPCDQIAETWKMRNEILADLEPNTSDARWWDPRLIPVTDSDGDGFCVHGDTGAVYYHVHDDSLEGPLFPSWFAMLEALAEEIEAGRFKVELESVWVELA